MGTLNSSTMVDTRTPGQADKYPEVLFYYANLLDYLRLVFLYWACCTDGVVYSTLQPLFGSDGMYFGVMYTISMGLDAFDGMLARAYDQCSKFGYYADMIIDRISSITALLYAAKALQDQNHPYAPLLVPLFFLYSVRRSTGPWCGVLLRGVHGSAPETAWSSVCSCAPLSGQQNHPFLSVHCI